MAQPTVTADAVVLRASPFGESDLVVHLLVRGHGRVGAFARGARKSTRRFGGGLEPFCVLSVEYAERRSAALVDLRGASLVTPHAALRADLLRLAHAGYATELVRELSHEHQANDRMYELLVGYYDALSAAGASSLLLRAFEVQAMEAAGLSPALNACVRCSADPTRDPASGFDPRAGGVVCGRCRRGDVALGPGALALLRALQRGGVAAAAKADASDLPLEPARRAMASFLAQHLQRELRSLSFLRDVGAPP